MVNRNKKIKFRCFVTHRCCGEVLNSGEQPLEGSCRGLDLEFESSRVRSDVMYAGGYVVEDRVGWSVWGVVGGVGWYKMVCQCAECHGQKFFMVPCGTESS